MKTVLLYIVFLLFFTLPVYSGGEILINGSIQACPLLFEPEYTITGIDFGTSWRLGYYNKLYTIGLKASFDYTLLDTMNPSDILQGTWLHTRALLDQEYAITPGFSVHWAAGIIWLNNSIKYGTTDMQTTDFYGMSFDLDLRFSLIKKFLQCEILNRVDLLYVLDSDFQIVNMAPHYYGGLRFYFDFGIKWFQVYLETKGQYWNYTDSADKISRIIASGGVGFCINLPPIKTGRDTTAKVAPDPLKNGDSSTGDNIIIEEKEKPDPDVEKLKTVKEGDRVQFNNILFIKHSDELLPVSYPVLDQITGVLKQRQGIIFTISAYAEYQENPAEEFKLYTSRAKKIKEYLIKGGIEEYRLKISSIGQIVTQNNPKSGSTVVFQVVNETASVK